MATGFDLARVDVEVAGTRFQGRISHVESVGSTNQLALDVAQAGARAGVWIADEQTAGRGRGNHAWHSAAGDGLYVSILVAPQVPLSQARSLPIAAGLATQAAVLEYTGLTLDLRWPNDLMFAAKKCGGILVESASESAPAGWQPVDGPGLRYAVIGIGLNLNHASFPPELASTATSLSLESGRQYEREPLLAALLRHIEAEMELLREGWLRRDQGAGLFARFTAASTWVTGKRVRVDEAGGYTGTTRGLDRHGFLQVLDDDGVVRTVLSGGVRPA